MSSRYPSGEGRTLDIQVSHSLGEIRMVDMQVRIIGIYIVFKAVGAGVITYGEHIVEDIEPQSRGLERIAF